ncbi:MAG: cytochrome-c peroxidase, partial [Pseudomonadota bacterium]
MVHTLTKWLTAAGMLTACSVAIMWPAQASKTTKPKPIAESDYRQVDPKSAALGRLLFYDKILSGNRNIACGTCHSHDHATADGLSLGVGEGGIGLGPKRVFGTGSDLPVKRVPRNANALFNLGHKDFRVLFHDGRLSADDTYGVGFNTTAEEWFPKGLTSIAAAQAMFPITSRVEMAGDPAENDIAASRRERIDHVWPRIARRVSGITEYRDRFDELGVEGGN